jgi:anti-sigma regulatory factor (Ser/Thr protein kinase)
MRKDFFAENTLASIVGLMGQALEFFQSQDLSPRSLFIAELGLEEMLTNTVKYAYDDDRPHRIEVRAEVKEGRVALEIHDDGHFFDPRQAPLPSSGVPLADQMKGGRGIHLVRKLVDQFEYQREAERNILLLGFPSHSKATTPGG